MNSSTSTALAKTVFVEQLIYPEDPFANSMLAVSFGECETKRTYSTPFFIGELGT
jgi:hypothetical protein